MTTNFFLYVSGSIHQGHELFSDISRGRQCSFMSLSALLCAQLCPVRQWSTLVVDEILIRGDTLYMKALESAEIPDTETLSLNYLPNRVEWASPSLQSRTQRNEFLIGSSCQANQLPISMQTSNHSPVMVRNTNLPVAVESIDEQVRANINSWWLINYEEFYQGRIFSDEHENEGPYSTLRSALMNAFSNNNFAFIILDGYVMALIKSADGIFVFDSHARNCYGMPDGNGTAVVMKCADINILVEYLATLSLELQSESFEVVPVRFYNEQDNTQFNTGLSSCRNSCKRKRCEQNECQKIKNLQKAREYKKRKLSEETECERQARLVTFQF